MEDALPWSVLDSLPILGTIPRLRCPLAPSSIYFLYPPQLP